MSYFIGLGFGVAIVLRLILMFGRESLPRGEPVPLEGEVAHARIGRGKHKAIDSLAVGFDVPGGWRFNLRREGVFDRFAKCVGLAREFQTRDMPFDGRIYIECDDAVLHRQLAVRRELRNQIYALFDNAAIQSLACARGKLWFTLSTAGLDKRLADEQIGRDAASPLQAGVRVLREQMAAPAVSDETARDPSRVTRRHFAIAILALAIAAGIGLLWQWRHADHQVVVDHIARVGIGTTATLAILLLVALLMTLGRTARVQRVLLDIVVAGIPAAWLASHAGAMYFNQRLDPSPVRRIPVPVERAWFTTSQKGNHDYFAELRWPDSRATPVIELRRGEYDILQSQACVDVLWRAGRFEDGWIERFQSHNSGDCIEEVEK